MVALLKLCGNFRYNLDAIYYATNAPGRSAFNMAERRMPSLSRAMAGLILPHDTYGMHLNASGRYSYVVFDVVKKPFRSVEIYNEQKNQRSQQTHYNLYTAVKSSFS